jgi:hypothetical protein
MKISCERELGSVERAELEAHAKLMARLGLIKDWTGNGMLYRHAGRDDSFHYIDQKYQ